MYGGSKSHEGKMNSPGIPTDFPSIRPVTEFVNKSKKKYIGGFSGSRRSALDHQTPPSPLPWVFSLFIHTAITQLMHRSLSARRPAGHADAMDARRSTSVERERPGDDQVPKIFFHLIVGPTLTQYKGIGVLWVTRWSPHSESHLVSPDRGY